MRPADLEPAAAAILADAWGDRRSWFSFALGSPACHAVVAEDSEAGVVGTGVATVNGPVGWIGTIWVAPAQRGHGLGQALTQWTIDAARSLGCRTLVLVATDSGRRLYERMGFQVQTWYRTMEAPGLPAQDSQSVDARIRMYRPADLDAIVALDRRATGEDRGDVIGALVSTDGTRILDGADGPAGYVIRAPWGGGATVAPDVSGALAILRARRVASGPDKRVRCGILLENTAGAQALEADGWTEAWRAPRLIRGEPLDWRPEQIWGQFNHAMG